MSDNVTVNELYLVVMPQISLSSNPGQVDQILTLLPDKKFASEFSATDAKSYVLMFKHREKYFIGGDVIGYSYHEEATPSGRYIVRVTQNVAN